MIIFLDNGHGVETTGKRSPDGVLREYKYTREIANEVAKRLQAKGYRVILVTPEQEDTIIPIRANRVNRYKGNKALLVSIHLDAFDDKPWTDAHGWSVRIAPNASQNSKLLADIFHKHVEKRGWFIKHQYPDKSYWVQNLGILRRSFCPAILTENLFQNNRQDYEYLLSDEGREAVITLHVDAIIDYIQQVEK